MKKTILIPALCVLTVCVFCFLTACGGKASPGAAGEENSAKGDIVVIKEKMFVAQINEIYVNRADYLGRTLRYEGFFQSYTDPCNDNTYYSVIRKGPGCCGTDGNCGFEVLWDKEYPAPEDWVEVTGVLEQYEEAGTAYLRLALLDWERKPEGKRVVTQ